MTSISPRLSLTAILLTLLTGASGRAAADPADPAASADPPDRIEPMEVAPPCETEAGRPRNRLPADARTASQTLTCTVRGVLPVRKPMPRPARALTCAPACRAGFVCQRGSCVSPCNPACGEGEVCAATGECVRRPPLPPPPAPVVVAAPAPVAPPPPPSFTATSAVGLGMKMALTGQVRMLGGMGLGAEELEPAYGLQPFVDLALGPRLTVGAAATLSFNVRPATERASARKLDLVARVGGVLPLGGSVRLFGRFCPGYSQILLLQSVAGPAGDPSGFQLGFEAGADVAITPDAFFSAGLAYDTSFHSQRLLARARDTQTQYLQLFAALGLTL